MSARAPQAIFNLYNKIDAPLKQLGGIVGDIAHSFGYHLSRNDLPGNDYSVTLSLDKQGPADCASALDISLPPAGMVTVTNRLLAAAKARDPRLRALREFCGTTDGVSTHPYDLSNGQDGPLNSWDSSHLWHVHLSFYRKYADDAAALAPIADVINGNKPAPKQEDDELSAAEVKAILDAIHDAVTVIVHGKDTDKPYTHPNSQDETGPVIRKVAADVATLVEKAGA